MASQPIDSIDTHTPTAESTTPATLLLVDDEPSILSALRRLFRPQGYRVLSAEGGQAALDLLQGETVDLVVHAADGGREVPVPS